MIAYIDSIKPYIEPSIFNRGVKLYLEGGVISKKDLLLDNWREYNVLDKHETYLVIIPILHLTLDSSRFGQVFEALNQVTQCECAFHLQFGICNHIVAVLAQMDKEFNSIPTISRSSASQSDILDTIFVAQKVKIHRKWLATVDALLSKENPNFYYIDEICKAIKDEPHEHSEFLQEFGRLLEPFIGYYLKEKRVLRIALESILIGKQIMWSFFLPFVLRMDSDIQTQFFITMWRYYWMDACEGYKDDFVSELRKLDLDKKLEIYNRLKKDFPGQPELSIEFCFASQYFTPLIEQKSMLPEKDLIQLTELVPDLRDSTDLILSGHLKTWSDFLKAGDYNEFLGLVNLWSDRLGKSEVFVETLKYIIANHTLKRSLVAKLRDLI
jgi:hypothetical protein